MGIEMVKLIKIVAHHEKPMEASKLFAKEEVVAVGWARSGTIDKKTKEEIIEMLVKEGIKNPEWGATQLLTFRDEIEIGDIVIAYATQNIVALVGEVTGDYKFNKDNLVGDPEGNIDYPNQKSMSWWDKPRFFHRNFLPDDLSASVASRGTIRILDRDVNVTKLKEWLEKIPLAEATREDILKVSGEDEIKEYLKMNLSELEDGLTLREVEYSISVGNIDILAEDNEGIPVIIEVKVEAGDSAIGQVSGYMQAYEEESDASRVRGMIVAQDFTERCRKAAKRIGIQLYECRKTFIVRKIEDF